LIFSPFRQREENQISIKLDLSHFALVFGKNQLGMRAGIRLRLWLRRDK
jgi:hypothetical protein